MRNAIITGSSKTSDIVGVLTGVWNEYDERGWHIVKTPFFVSLSATLQAGPQILPVTPRSALVGEREQQRSDCNQGDGQEFRIARERCG